MKRFANPGRLLLLLVAVLTLVVVTGDRNTEAHKGITSPYTYNKDVFPIVRDSCARWLRWLVVVLLCMVCLQGLLGGLRVTGRPTIDVDRATLADCCGTSHNSTLESVWWVDSLGLLVAPGILGAATLDGAAWCAGVAAPASVNGLTFVGWDEPIACGGGAVLRQGGSHIGASRETRRRQLLPQ
jgi:hypothetical protein